MSSLPAVCTAYLAERVLAPEYEKNLARVAKNCQHLSAEKINAYLKARLTQVSSKTVSNERAMILILWRWAYDRQMVDHFPRGIVRIKVPSRPVRAWTIAQCRTAVKQTAGESGKLMRCGVDRALFLRCWMLLGYATGARFQDLWLMSKENIEDSVLRYSQNKTGNAITVHLPDNCLEAVNAMLDHSPDGTILGWTCKKRRAMRLMKAHLKACSLSGSSKWLRRSAATHVEMSSPGKARAFLGHKTPTMVRHYLDMGQLMEDVPQPPCLIE